MERLAPSSESGGGAFSSQSLALRTQKKLLGKLSTRNVAKQFVGERVSCLLDNLYRLLKEFYTKKEAEKVLKNLIKMAVKLELLSRNDRFSADEQRRLVEFQRKLRSLLMTVISFRQVDFSYERNFLIKRLEETKSCLAPLVEGHLSDKSSQRVDMVFAYFGRADFLDAVFAGKQTEKYSRLVDSVVGQVSLLIDEGGV